jgi:hypothetical protein
MRHRSLFGLVAAAVCTLAPSLASAQVLVIGLPQYSGTGCPQGSVSSVTTADRRTLSIMFSSFDVRTEQGRMMARTGCTLIVPVQVAGGQRINSMALDYRGYAYLALAQKAQFQYEYRVGDRSVSKEANEFTGPFDQNMVMSHPVPPDAFACGGSYNVVIDVNLMLLKLSSNPSQEEAYGALDSADLAPLMQVHFDTVACPPPPPPCGIVPTNQPLTAGSVIQSCNGQYKLVQQGDKNLVIYRGATATWSTLTGPIGSPGAPHKGYGGLGDTAIMQGDGNFVLYNAGKATWNSQTWGNAGAVLIMQDDGNLVIYRNGKALWSWMTGKL